VRPLTAVRGSAVRSERVVLRLTLPARVSSSSDASERALEAVVRTTLALDDELVQEAQRLTGTTEKSALVRQALRALIERESARRLARLGGSEPHLEVSPRRQTAPPA
jgi:Arc/MetJ family transcription regulator